MFSRCYPTMTDMLRDFTGIDIPLPIFSYGFFVALGFLAAAYVLLLEMKRKEKLGLLKPFKREITKGEPPKTSEIILNALLGFIIGFKLILIVTNWTDFSSNPQEMLLSLRGSWLGGIAGAALFAWMKYREKKKEQLDKPKTELVDVYPHETVGDMTIVAAIAGIIGAKLFYFIEAPGNFSEFLERPTENFFGGLTVYGGLILGAICVLWYAKNRGMNPIHVADACSPGLFLAYTFGRQGCQVSGDGDWGIDNLQPKPDWLSWLPDRLWAFDYPYNIANAGTPIPGCTEQYCKVLEQNVFPTPMYECAETLLLFALLWAIRKRITIPGLMFSLYFILNGIQRFTIERIRDNKRLDFLGLNLTQAEIIAVLFVLIGIAGIFYFTQKHKKASAST